MAAARPILSIVSLVLLAGGVLLQLLTILSGVVDHTFIGKIYFLEASTSGISSSSGPVPNPARWTYFALCGADSSGYNSNCGPVKPALPFNPPGVNNFDTTKGVPQQLVNDQKTYYYLSRFMFAFYLIALFFAVCALFLSLAAMFARLGAYLAGMTTFLALFFQALTASLMTAWTVLGEKAFKSNGQTAKLGVYAYGFTWAAFACFLIATVLFCIGGSAGKSESSGGGGGYFGRKKSQKSTKSNRGSFYDSEDGARRGVKDEYD